MPEITTRRIYFILLSTFFSVSLLHAQDIATPMVHQEHFHTPVYQNDTIRVLNVCASPGDTTAFHRHCLPILYFTLNGTEVSLQEPLGEWQNVELPTNWCGHDTYWTDSCFTHRFSVVGKDSLQLIAVEGLLEGVAPKFGFEPAYSGGGFSLFRILPQQWSEVTSVSVPLVLVAQDCETFCDVFVIDSARLTLNQLRDNKVLAIFYSQAH